MIHFHNTPFFTQPHLAKQDVPHFRRPEGLLVLGLGRQIPLLTRPGFLEYISN